MNSVMKGAGYILVHTPDMVIHNGTTQTTERIVNPESDYLKELPTRLRSYNRARAYYPNQVYIGNMTPLELKEIPGPWHDQTSPTDDRFGPFGEIMPQDEFYLLIQAVDEFELVFLDKDFVAITKPRMQANPIISDYLFNRVKEGIDQAKLKELINVEGAEGLYIKDQIVGAVRRAHDIDSNLSAHVMIENLVSKASSTLALLYAVKNAGIDPNGVEYTIDCSEEACGDMNQRGGGNFAKATAEMAQLTGSTGSDVRGFCAAPAHAVVLAASLVKAGTFKTVAVTAGGSTAKLGMNGKDHVKKDLPVLEDCLAGFAVIISENDGVSPEIIVSNPGRHAVGTGSSPQNVIASLVTEPLAKVNLKVTDVDYYSPEMQNPDITKPAGAGNVPESNMKMIGALAVKQGDLERADLNNFVDRHGLPGFAPTQGHIPSGVPYMGHARNALVNKEIKRAMIIGKGSLFLGRMTNLFDGISFLMEQNRGKEEKASISGEPAQVLETGPSAKNPTVAVMGLGSELGEATVMEGCVKAVGQGIDILYLGTIETEGVTTLHHDCAEDALAQMEELLKNKTADAAVAMHYPFPIGVTTIGKIKAPATGRDFYLASTTGSSSTDRVEALVLNTLAGIATARADGVKDPTVGLLNLDGARQAELLLKSLRENGYPLHFAKSGRADGGAVMRGNDVLQASQDVLVVDSLTGNALLKLLSAYSSGGSYETVGAGYGPGIGEKMGGIVNIISRASGAPVIAESIQFAAQAAKNRIKELYLNELALARKAGLDELLRNRQNMAARPKDAEAPPKEVVTEQIEGIDVLDLEDAVQLLWSKQVYAESGMGCTGPIVRVSSLKLDNARKILHEGGFIGE